MDSITLEYTNKALLKALKELMELFNSADCLKDSARARARRARVWTQAKEAVKLAEGAQ